MDVPSISAVSWGTHRLDIFALGFENNNMFHRAWSEDEGWQPISEWEYLDGTFSSPPAAVSWDRARLDIFGLGIVNDMFHKAWDGDWRPSKTGWGDPLPVGRFIGPPAAVSTGERQLDIFGLSNYNSVEYIRYNGNRGWDFESFFLGWPALGVKFLSPPAAVSRDKDTVDVVAIGTNNSLYRKTFNVTGEIPKDWLHIGGTWRSTPAVVSAGYRRLDVFAIGTNNKMYHKFYDPASPGDHWYPSTKGWDPFNGVWFSPPVAVSWGFHRLDVFAIGTNNSLYHTASDDGIKFSDWQKLGGVWTSPPAVVSWGGHRLDVFVISRENNIFHTSSDDGKKFSGWKNLGGVFKRFL